MFLGQYKYNIDDKGRLVIPQDFRSELGTRIVINKGFEKCLTIYPVSIWNEQVEKMSELSITQKDNRAFSRFFMASAFYKEFDNQGRITIEEVLKKYANITKGCVIAGANKVIEIWSAEDWEIIEKQRDEEFEGVSEKIVF